MKLDDMVASPESAACGLSQGSGCGAVGSNRIPWSFALAAWYVVIKFLLIYPAALRPIILEAWWTRLGATAATIFFMALLMPIYLRRDGLAVADLGFSSDFRGRDLILGIAAGGCIWTLHHGLLRIGELLTGGVEINVGALQNARAIGFAGPPVIIGRILGGCVLAPIMEEVVDRACILVPIWECWSPSRWRDPAAFLISGLIFAVTHQLGHPIYVGIYALTGIAFAYVYRETRSLNVVMIAHAVVNGVYIMRSF